MKLYPKKLKTLGVIALVLNILFLLVIIYDAFIIRDLYKTLNQQQPYQSIGRITRINTQALDKATQRFSGAQNYIPPTPNFGDPFSNPVPKVQ